jgi:cytochrome c553
VKSAILITLGLVLTVNVQAAGSVAEGKEKSKPCASCHGPDGNSVAPNYPKLAGQYEDYIFQALLDYKSGARENPIMSGQAASLSVQDMEDLAAYYSAQQGVVSSEVGEH